MVGFLGALGWERYPFFAEAVFLRLVGGPSFGGDMPTTEKTPCGFCSNTWINRSAAWDGLRVPCSQLCTVFGETFNSRANTAWDIWLFSRMRVTSSAPSSGGRSGTSSIVVLRVTSPLAWRIASSRPFRIWSATGSRFDGSFMRSSLSLGLSGLILQHLDELPVELLLIGREIVVGEVRLHPGGELARLDENLLHSILLCGTETNSRMRTAPNDRGTRR